MSDILMCANNISKTYTSGVSVLTVLKNVSLTINTGEFVALTGASGVGKSTLLHILGGLDRASDGDVLYRNRSLANQTDSELADFRNREIGFVFQFHHLLPEFTAAENVAMPLLIRRMTKSKALNAADNFLEQVGLADRSSHKPGQLSGGEQQRVALARAMITNPSLILADEPTGNLDEDTALKVFNIMSDLNVRYSVAFLIATHNLDLARSAHRWLQLGDGRIHEITIESCDTKRGI